MEGSATACSLLEAPTSSLTLESTPEERLQDSIKESERAMEEWRRVSGQIVRVEDSDARDMRLEEAEQAVRTQAREAEMLASELSEAARASSEAKHSMSVAIHAHRAWESSHGHALFGSQASHPRMQALGEKHAEARDRAKMEYDNRKAHEDEKRMQANFKASELQQSIGLVRKLRQQSSIKGPTRAHAVVPSLASRKRTPLPLAATASSSKTELGVDAPVSLTLKHRRRNVPVQDSPMALAELTASVPPASPMESMGLHGEHPGSVPAKGRMANRMAADDLAAWRDLANDIDTESQVAVELQRRSRTIRALSASNARPSTLRIQSPSLQSASLQASSPRRTPLPRFKSTEEPLELRLPPQRAPSSLIATSVSSGQPSPTSNRAQSAHLPPSSANADLLKTRLELEDVQNRLDSEASRAARAAHQKELALLELRRAQDTIKRYEANARTYEDLFMEQASDMHDQRKSLHAKIEELNVALREAKRKEAEAMSASKKSDLKARELEIKLAAKDTEYASAMSRLVQENKKLRSEAAAYERQLGEMLSEKAQLSASLSSVELERAEEKKELRVRELKWRADLKKEMERASLLQKNHSEAVEDYKSKFEKAKAEHRAEVYQLRTMIERLQEMHADLQDLAELQLRNQIEESEDEQIECPVSGENRKLKIATRLPTGTSKETPEIIIPIPKLESPLAKKCARDVWREERGRRTSGAARSANLPLTGSRQNALREFERKADEASSEAIEKASLTFGQQAAKFEDLQSRMARYASMCRSKSRKSKKGNIPSRSAQLLEEKQRAVMSKAASRRALSSVLEMVEPPGALSGAQLRRTSSENQRRRRIARLLSGNEARLDAEADIRSWTESDKHKVFRRKYEQMLQI
jgi:hypothetical protein